MGQSESSPSLCCVPLIPLRGMRSSQVQIEVFDGWTRREMEGLHKIVLKASPLASPPALGDSSTPTSVDRLTTPLNKITFDDMIKKAKMAAESRANAQQVMIMPLDHTQESNVGSGDSPRNVDMAEIKNQAESDLKNSETDKPTNRSLRQRIRQCIALKRKGSQKDIDIEKVIQDSTKCAKDVKEPAQNMLPSYVMDSGFDAIRSYRRSDVVYGPQKVVRKFGQMLMDMDVEDIKNYCGRFVKIYPTADV